MKKNFFAVLKNPYIFLVIIVVVSSIILGKNILKLRKEVSILSKELSIVSKEVSIVSKEVLTLSETIRFSQTRDILVEFLKTYSAYDQNGPLKLIRYGREHDGGYVVAEKALEQADVFLGYGIADDNSFEDQFSLQYNKPSYGFDCGVESIVSKSKLFTLVTECIASDAFLYNKGSSSGRVSSFNKQLANLHLTGKKIFIKMDIEGAEYDAFPEIIRHQKNITGIVLEIHFDAAKTKDALNLLKYLSKHFVLVHVHGNNCTDLGFSTPNSTGIIPGVIELSYINKALVTSYSLSEDQSHPLMIDQPNCQGKPDSVFTIIH
jgi:hypothetical protein